MTVLVVEDEALVRMIAVDMLEDAGFAVREAHNADAALAILESMDGSLGILFTDIDMPGSMDGLALAACVAERWPWIGIVVTSGRARPGSCDLPPGGRFLSKPYASANLETSVRDAG